jgi:hypothetical protein
MVSRLTDDLLHIGTWNKMMFELNKSKKIVKTADGKTGRRREEEGKKKRRRREEDRSEDGMVLVLSCI